MRTWLHWGRHSRRGVAALEFALTFPVVLYLFSGVADLGIVYYRQIALSSSVSAAAHYADVTDQKTGSVTATNVQTVLQNAAAQSMPSTTVNASAACYCITGTATSDWNTSSPIACSGSCGSGTTSMKYMLITLTHSYNAILPWSMVGSPTLKASTWLPLL